MIKTRDYAHHCHTHACDGHFHADALCRNLSKMVILYFHIREDPLSLNACKYMEVLNPEKD
jgi:hypothetical protein